MPPQDVVHDIITKDRGAGRTGFGLQQPEADSPLDPSVARASIIFYYGGDTSPGER